MVDDADRERVAEYKWSWDGAYAARNVGSNGEREKVYLHRFIMGLPPGDPRKVTFKDGDSLNCCQENLEVSDMPFSELHAIFLRNMAHFGSPVPLADELGVSPDAIRELQVGFYPAENAWIFPERDEQGKIIGLLKRPYNGKKIAHKGSKRGLYFTPLAKRSSTGQVQFAGVWYWRVTADNPCPICGRKKYCLVSNPADDPAQVICMKTKEGSIRSVSCGGEGYLHVRRGQELSAESRPFASLPGPVVVTEGASDCLMAMTLGYAAVGLPSAGGAIPELKKLLKGCADVIVVGDEDGPGGVGRREARNVVEALKAVCEQVRLVFPPPPHKDLRAWHPNVAEFEQWVRESAEVEKSDTIVESENQAELAEKFLTAQYGDAPLRFANGEFWTWEGYYQMIDKEVMESQLIAYLRTVTIRTGTGNNFNSRKPRTSRNFIGDVLFNLSRNPKCLVRVPKGRYELFSIESGEYIDVARTIVFRNGLLDVDMGILRRLKPDIFVTSTLPYDYHPDAKCHLWKGFVQDVFNGDQASHDLLQEWYGYNLIASNFMQQMMFLYGEPNSGKSTTVDVLSAMLGEDRCCPISLDELTKDSFGLEPLIGKYAATLAEEKPSSRKEAERVVNALKRITGQDSVSVRRKYKTSVQAKLICRFTYVGNQLPQYTDNSGAFMRRVNILHYPNNYRKLGKRLDRSLGRKLQAEAPGIAIWALEGLKRLLSNGDFTRPERSEEYLQDMEDTASPIKRIIEEHCEFVPKVTTLTQMLFDLYRAVRKAENASDDETLQSFGSQLKQLFPSLDRTRPREDGTRHYGYKGIRIRKESQQKYLGRP